MIGQINDRLADTKRPRPGMFGILQLYEERLRALKAISERQEGQRSEIQKQIERFKRDVQDIKISSTEYRASRYDFIERYKRNREKTSERDSLKAAHDHNVAAYHGVSNEDRSISMLQDSAQRQAFPEQVAASTCQSTETG